MSRKKSVSFAMAFIMAVSLFTGLTFEVKTAAAEENLVLHLKFDGDLSDASGNGNNAECTYGKITYTDGIYGQAAVFNGKSYVEIVDNASLDLNNFTISLWAYKTKNFNSDNNIPYIYKQEDEESWATPYSVYEMADNIPLIYLHDTSDGTEMDQFTVMGNPIDVRKWFLLTATYNGSEVRIYENETMMKKVSVTGNPADTIGNLYIGMMEGEYYYNGYMDDLRIYDRGLSASEVTELYENGLSTKPEFLTQKDDLIAHYKFNGDFKDATSYGNNAELVTGKVSFIDGKNGKAAKFSNNTYLEVLNNESLEFDQGFTMTGWIIDYKESTSMALFNKTGVSTIDLSDYYAYRFSIWDNSYDFNYVPFGNQTGNETTSYGFEDTNINKWTHVAVTFDTEEFRWYINGKMVLKEEVSDYNGSSIAHSSGNLTIGTDGEDFFDGAVDELKLYNYALSADAVAKDYGKVDSLFISSANQKSIKAMKAKGTVKLEVSRKYIDTGKTGKLTSGVTYKTSNKKVFTVSKTGVITAVKKGTANLTISHGAISQTYKITVK
jgi:hypothetical protein